MSGGVFEDDNGNASSNRLVTIGWFGVLGSAILLATWKADGTLPDIPDGIVQITLGVIAGKQVGKWLEGIGGCKNVVTKNEKEG